MGDCSICLDSLTSENFVNGVYTIADCKHQFHTDCFLSWCKQGVFNCPLCRTECVNLNFSDKRQKLSFLRKLSLKKCSPPMLKELGAKYRDDEKKLIEIRREFNECKKINKDILMDIRKKRNKFYNQYEKVNESKNSLLGFPILELPRECRVIIR